MKTKGHKHSHGQKEKYQNSGQEVTSVLPDHLLQHPDPLLERGLVFLQRGILRLQQRDPMAIRFSGLQLL